MPHYQDILLRQSYMMPHCQDMLLRQSHMINGCCFSVMSSTKCHLEHSVHIIDPQRRWESKSVFHNQFFYILVFISDDIAIINNTDVKKKGCWIDDMGKQWQTGFEIATKQWHFKYQL